MYPVALVERSTVGWQCTFDVESYKADGTTLISTATSVATDGVITGFTTLSGGQNPIGNGVAFIRVKATFQESGVHSAKTLKVGQIGMVAVPNQLASGGNWLDAFGITATGFIDAPSKKDLIALSWVQSDIATSGGTAARLSDMAQDAAGYMVMPWDGRLIGLSIRSSAARVTGTALGRMNRNGVGMLGITATLDGTNVQNMYGKGGSGDTFAVGDRIGVDIMTSSWTPTTADFVVTLWLLIDTTS
jgi:hypothetical protein